MADVIHHDRVVEKESGGNGLAMLLAVISLGLLALALFYRGVPALTNGANTTPAPEVNVNGAIPDQVDVNVKTE